MLSVFSNELLGESEIDEVDDVLLLRRAYIKVDLPTKKLSGLISRCINFLEWTNSILWRICRPIVTVVGRSKDRSQATNKSSNEGPSRSMTMTLYYPSVDEKYI